MHREGYGLVFAFTVCSLAATLGGWFWLNDGLLKGIAIFGWILTLFTVYFFRDPDRTVPAVANAIVSPADGVVIEIATVDEPIFLKGQALKVSIFMNVFNVHVNRTPISGVVRYFEYRKGRFLRANLDEASTENEQAIIGIDDGQHKVLFKQIAGLIARRVVCELREGHKVNKGERMGIIKFGSRVDIFMPVAVELHVELKDKVKSGESIIGVFKNVL